MKIVFNFLILVFVIAAFTACEENYTPKPKGYFRIDLPEKSYIKLDSVFPFKFEYPVYANISDDPFSPNQRIHHHSPDTAWYYQRRPARRRTG